MQNDTVSAIRGFQQVSEPGALSFCIKGHTACWSMVVWSPKGREWGAVLATNGLTTLPVTTSNRWVVTNVYSVRITTSWTNRCYLEFSNRNTDIVAWKHQIRVSDLPCLQVLPHLDLSVIYVSALNPRRGYVETRTHTPDPTPRLGSVAFPTQTLPGSPAP